MLKLTCKQYLKVGHGRGSNFYSLICDIFIFKLIIHLLYKGRAVITATVKLSKNQFNRQIV